MFCALLIFTMGPLRIGDGVEVLEGGDKSGVRGRVMASNLFYTTPEDLSGDAPGAWVQIPDSLFFQKAVRRWRNGQLPTPCSPEG
jgi:small-conductance mechanosensitive channel